MTCIAAPATTRGSVWRPWMTRHGRGCAASYRGWRRWAALRCGNGCNVAQPLMRRWPHGCAHDPRPTTPGYWRAPGLPRRHWRHHATSSKARICGRAASGKRTAAACCPGCLGARASAVNPVPRPSWERIPTDCCARFWECPLRTLLRCAGPGRLADVKDQAHASAWGRGVASACGRTHTGTVSCGEFFRRPLGSLPSIQRGRRMEDRARSGEVAAQEVEPRSAAISASAASRSATTLSRSAAILPSSMFPAPKIASLPASDPRSKKSGDRPVGANNVPLS